MKKNTVHDMAVHLNVRIMLIQYLKLRLPIEYRTTFIEIR